MQTNFPLMRGAWTFADYANIPKNGKKVFSCFHCGGGSTMGYKLAGFNVLGGVEIDKKMMGIYRANHTPKHSFLMGVQDFCKIPRADLPKELLSLDILDGSPPCSSFSMAGAREKKWGQKHHFREGQAKQMLDDLFFHFIKTARILQPKIVVAENVKGLIFGNAKGYVKEIFQAFRSAGYETQLYLLDSSKMGVPQRQERIFFIARRKDLELKKLELFFCEREIGIASAIANVKASKKITWLTPETKVLWEKVKPGESLKKAHPKGYRFNAYIANPTRPIRTITASADAVPIHWKVPRRFTAEEMCRVQSFPDDFNFLDNNPNYVMGMSVPPFMVQRIAHQINLQLLS